MPGCTNPAGGAGWPVALATVETGASLYRGLLVSSVAFLAENAAEASAMLTRQYSISGRRSCLIAAFLRQPKYSEIGSAFHAPATGSAPWAPHPAGRHS